MRHIYPIHGFARPVRLEYPLGNAFAEERLRQRRSDLTAYQYKMVAERHDAAQHYHAACHQDEAESQQAFAPTGHQNDDGFPGSSTDLGRPVSSWSFVNNHNNNNNVSQGTLESSHKPEPLPAHGSAAAHLAVQQFLLPENDLLLKNIPEVDQAEEVGYSQLLRSFAQLHLELEMPKRDRDTAFRQASSSSEPTRARGAERTQEALQDLGSNHNMDRQAEVGDQALPSARKLSSKSDIDRRTDRTPTDRVNAGNPSSESNVSRRTKVHSKARRRPPYLAAESEMSHRTNRNKSTPLRFDDNTTEFKPRRVERNQPTLLPPGDYRYPILINDDLIRPVDDGTMPRTEQYNQPIPVMSVGSESVLVSPGRLDRDLPALPHPKCPSTTSTPPPIQPSLPRAGIPEYYVKKAVKNDGIILGDGPLIPTRDGRYAATGMARTVQGRPITSMMGTLGCSTPLAAAFPVSVPVPSPPTFRPIFSVPPPVSSAAADPFTLDQLIKRVDRLQMKQEADRALIAGLLRAQKEDREEIEALKRRM